MKGALYCVLLLLVGVDWIVDLRKQAFGAPTTEAEDFVFTLADIVYPVDLSHNNFTQEEKCLIDGVVETLNHMNSSSSMCSYHVGLWDAIKDCGEGKLAVERRANDRLKSKCDPDAHLGQPASPARRCVTKSVAKYLAALLYYDNFCIEPKNARCSRCGLMTEYLIGLKECSLGLRTKKLEEDMAEHLQKICYAEKQERKCENSAILRESLGKLEGNDECSIKTRFSADLKKCYHDEKDNTLAIFPPTLACNEPSAAKAMNESERCMLKSRIIGFHSFMKNTELCVYMTGMLAELERCPQELDVKRELADTRGHVKSLNCQPKNSTYILPMERKRNEQSVCHNHAFLRHELGKVEGIDKCSLAKRHNHDMQKCYPENKEQYQSQLRNITASCENVALNETQKCIVKSRIIAHATNQDTADGFCGAVTSMLAELESCPRGVDVTEAQESLKKTFNGYCPGEEEPKSIPGPSLSLDLNKTTIDRRESGQDSTSSHFLKLANNNTFSEEEQCHYRAFTRLLRRKLNGYDECRVYKEYLIGLQACYPEAKEDYQIVLDEYAECEKKGRQPEALSERNKCILKAEIAGFESALRENNKCKGFGTALSYSKQCAPNGNWQNLSEQLRQTFWGCSEHANKEQ